MNNESENSRAVTSPICLFFLPESKMASRPWTQSAHASSCGRQKGFRGQCYSRSPEGGKDLPTAKGRCKNVDIQIQGSGQDSHRGGSQGHPLADILGVKRECGHLQKAAVCELEKGTPSQRKNYRHALWVDRSGKGCLCRQYS